MRDSLPITLHLNLGYRAVEKTKVDSGSPRLEPAQSVHTGHTKATVPHPINGEQREVISVLPAIAPQSPAWAAGPGSIPPFSLYLPAFPFQRLGGQPASSHHISAMEA